MTREEIIEQTAQVLSTHETFTGKPHPRDHHRRQARALADAGMLAQPMPDRDEIAMSIAARHWDRDSGDVEAWHDLTDSEKENVSENYLTWDSADAVLDLLKGQDR